MSTGAIARSDQSLMEHDEVDGRVRVLRGAAQRHVAGDDAECAFEIDPVGNARQRHVVSGAKEAMAHPPVHRRAVGFDRRQVERLLHQFAVRWKGRAVAPFPCARQIVPPNALSGEGRRGGIGEQARSRVGIEAVCGDHREISIADVVRKDDIDALAIVDRVLNGEAQADGDAQVPGAVGQDPLQGRAADAHVRPATLDQLGLGTIATRLPVGMEISTWSSPWPAATCSSSGPSWSIAHPTFDCCMIPTPWTLQSASRSIRSTSKPLRRSAIAAVIPPITKNCRIHLSPEPRGRTD